MQAPAIIPRRELWRSLPVDNLRDVVADSFDQNDREHYSMVADLRAIKQLLTGILITLATASVMLAANLAMGTVG